MWPLCRRSSIEGVRREPGTPSQPGRRRAPTGRSGGVSSAREAPHRLSTTVATPHFRQPSSASWQNSSLPCSHPFGDFAVPNALSERFELDLWFEGEGWTAEYERGRPVRGAFATSGHPGSGTRVRFTPDPTIFSSVDFDVERLAARLDELAALHAGIAVGINADGLSRSWRRPGGLGDWISEWDPTPTEGTCVFHGVLNTGAIGCEVAWRWADRGESRVRSWVNAVETKDGGSHAKAFLRNVRVRAAGEGKVLVGAVHVELRHPRPASPIKSELDVPEVGEFVKAAVHAARLDLPG
ncbi:hypothetical protein [Enhygromyxa salina]|uniref:hypothetical protein n=1 Tax=Enhygromyxa salina TaxID=215803 RepID=UPI0011BADD92|nr:hypothetical protein [Enhygromyxa salina]